MNSKKHIIFCLIFCLVTGVLFPGNSFAATAKEKYLQADKYYSWLKNHAKYQKYRDKWLTCIKKYQAVYRHDPDGSWAAAGMYKSGEVYYELYKRSFRKSDRTEALDTFERIIKRYPKSRYRKRAEAAIRSIKQKQPPPTSNKKSTNQEQKYSRAETCYQDLLKNSRKQKYRDKWFLCIDKFQDVYRTDPDGPKAAAAMYQSGVLYHELYKHSFKKSDKTEALSLLDRTVENYPDSPYAEKAEAKFVAITGKKRTPKPADSIEKVILDSSSKPQEESASTTSQSTGSHATVQGLRHWSNPSYTRIVIDASRQTSYQHRLLKQDPKIKKPQRLYVDLNQSRLRKDIEKVVAINDNLLSNVRAGQYTNDKVRVVIDIKSFKTYKIFSLRNPFRIVIDVWGVSSTARTPLKTDSQTALKDQKVSPGALAKQLSLGVSRIVIDPGHGGRDYGAPGYYKGVHEKKITLALAKKLAQKIRDKLSCKVFLTRQSDKYLTLEERTAIANTKNADLFISIHTNSAKDQRAYGIETYFLNLATDDEAIRVAATENATSAKNISDLETILSDLMQNAKINESSRLAAFVQGALYSHLKKDYAKIRSKGVKQAPFYVLLGAQMPAILIETSFISNPRECKRLTNTHYQDQLCEGIVKGIREYIKETNPTAYYRHSQKKNTSG